MSLLFTAIVGFACLIIGAYSHKWLARKEAQATTAAHEAVAGKIAKAAVEVGATLKAAV